MVSAFEKKGHLEKWIIEEEEAVQVISDDVWDAKAAEYSVSKPCFP